MSIKELAHRRASKKSDYCTQNLEVGLQKIHNYYVESSKGNGQLSKKVLRNRKRIKNLFSITRNHSYKCLSDLQREASNRGNKDKKLKQANRGGCIYAVYNERFEFYLGSTDDINTRLYQHFYNCQKHIEGNPADSIKNSRFYKHITRRSKEVHVVVLRNFDRIKECRLVETSFIRMLRPRLNSLCNSGFVEHRKINVIIALTLK